MEFGTKRILITACMVLTSTGAFAQVGEKTGVNSALGMAPKAPDFVKMVAVSDMFEIESSKPAQDRADAASKTFSARMVKDHTVTSAELKSIASAKFEVPTASENGPGFGGRRWRCEEEVKRMHERMDATGRRVMVGLSFEETSEFELLEAPLAMYTTDLRWLDLFNKHDQARTHISRQKQMELL